MLTQKEKQELERTRVFQVFGPLIAASGREFTKFLKYINSPEGRKEIAGVWAAAKHDSKVMILEMIQDHFKGQSITMPGWITEGIKSGINLYRNRSEYQ